MTRRRAAFDPLTVGDALLGKRCVRCRTVFRVGDVLALPDAGDLSDIERHLRHADCDDPRGERRDPDDGRP